MYSISLPHAPGVYRIICLPSKKVYIGSTSDLARRWPEHRKELRGNRHPNAHLQSAWNKYGESQFQYEVIEIILASFVTEREQYWIDRTKCSDRRYGFNKAPVADPPSGYHLSDDRKQAIGMRGNKTWEGFIDPDGNDVTIVGLTGFCRLHGLSYTTMSRMAYGSKSALQHKGWTHRNADRPRQQFKDLSGFIRPDGTPEPTPRSVKELCQKNGLKWKSIYALMSGIIQTHQGWRYERDDDAI
jgi:group I intron endonuclease